MLVYVISENPLRIFERMLESSSHKQGKWGLEIWHHLPKWRLRGAWLLSLVWAFATPWTGARQAPLSTGVLQARTLEWVAISFSQGSSQPRDGTQVSHTAGGFFTSWAQTNSNAKSESVSHSALSYFCFPCSSVCKESACSAGDLGSIPGSGRSPGEGNGNPLQYPCLQNLMDIGAWWAAVHGVAKSQARLRLNLLTCVQLFVTPWTVSHQDPLSMKFSR